jgi:hypothetical protein
MNNDNKTLYILLGIGAGIGVYFFLCKRWKEKQGQQIAMQNQQVVQE